MDKIYLVYASFKYWDIYNVRLLKAFKKQENAKKYIEKANRVLRLMSNHVSDAFNKTNIHINDYSDINVEELLKLSDEYEQTETYKKALNIWSAHSELEGFNECYVEEITVI
jgi:hypothetical protein